MRQTSPLPTVSDIEGRCLVHDEGGVRILTIDRIAKRNALTLSMFEAFAAALKTADADDQVRAVIVTGAGTHFTAGHDLQAFAAWPQLPGDPVPRAFHALAAMRKPVVMAVRGAAIGFGTTALLHADWVVSAPDAQFRLPFVDLAIGPESGASVLLARAVGEQRARGWLMRGAAFDGQEAHVAGLVHELAAPEAVQAVALARAHEFVAKNPQALARMKRLLRLPAKELESLINREIAAINSALADISGPK